MSDASQIAAAAAAAARHVAPASVGGLQLGWTTVLVGLLNVLVGGVLVALVKNLPMLKDMANRREEIANRKEANLLTERAAEMATMRDTIQRLESRLDAKDILHDAERAYDRHRINNLAGCLNSFFLLVKNNPRNAADAAAEIEKMRKAQVEAEEKEAMELRRLHTDLKMNIAPTPPSLPR